MSGFDPLYAARKVTLGNAPAKAVLRDLAQYANEEGSCFPLPRTIAQNTELQLRTVQRILQAFSLMGLVTRHAITGKHYDHYYQINLAMLVTADDDGPANLSHAFDRVYRSLQGKGDGRADQGGVSETHQSVSETGESVSETHQRVSETRDSVSETFPPHPLIGVTAIELPLNQKPAPVVIEAVAATESKRQQQRQEPSCEVEASPRLTLVAPETKASRDSRFPECVAAVKTYVQHMGCVLQWGKAEGAQLKRLLEASPALTVETFKACLHARARSPVSHGEPPCVWLPTLLQYQVGPLDRFKVPRGGSDGTGNGHSGRNGSGSTRTDGNYAAAAELWSEMYGTAAAAG